MKNITCLILSLLLTIPGFSQSGRSSENLEQMEAQIIVLVNKHRASLNLPPLKQDPLLTSLARTHSMNMANRKVSFSHKGFTDRNKAYKKERGFVSLFAENIAKGPTNAEDAMEIWLHSEGHRQNIEGAFQYTGVGVAKSKEGLLLFTQLFSSL